jgi:hypothetical protein
VATPETAKQARCFLQKNWLQEGAETWRALLEQRDGSGLSGCLGLPENTQQSCHVCVVCVRRPACGHTGHGPECGLIRQQTKAAHVRTGAHKLALANCNVDIARREAAAAEAAAVAATAEAAAADDRVRVAEATAAQAGRLKGLQQAMKRLSNNDRKQAFINEHKITAIKNAVEIKKGLAGLSTSSTETWKTPSILSEELHRESSAPPTQRPVDKGRVGGKPAIAAAAMVRAPLPLQTVCCSSLKCMCAGVIGTLRFDGNACGG